MSKEIEETTRVPLSPFERIKRTNDAGMEFWSSREFEDLLTGFREYKLNYTGFSEQ
jgi:hypothetical protein